MSQGDLKGGKFDFNVVLNGKEMEISFPAFVEIDRAIDQSIKIAREFGTRTVLIFKGSKILVDKDSLFKDVMEKYIFG